MLMGRWLFTSRAIEEVSVNGSLPYAVWQVRGLGPALSRLADLLV